METPVGPVEEQVPNYVEPVGLGPAPEGPIATPAFLETLAQIVSVYTSLA